MKQKTTVGTLKVVHEEKKLNSPYRNVTSPNNKSLISKIASHFTTSKTPNKSSTTAPKKATLPEVDLKYTASASPMSVLSDRSSILYSTDPTMSTGSFSSTDGSFYVDEENEEGFYATNTKLWGSNINVNNKRMYSKSVNTPVQNKSQIVVAKQEPMIRSVMQSYPSSTTTAIKRNTPVLNIKSPVKRSSSPARHQRKLSNTDLITFDSPSKQATSTRKYASPVVSTRNPRALPPVPVQLQKPVSSFSHRVISHEIEAQPLHIQKPLPNLVLSEQSISYLQHSIEPQTSSKAASSPIGMLNMRRAKQIVYINNETKSIMFENRPISKSLKEVAVDVLVYLLLEDEMPVSEQGAKDSLRLREYVSNVVIKVSRNTGVDDRCLLGAVLYMDKLFYNVKIEMSNFIKTFACCVMLASKFHEDFYMQNQSWYKRFKFTELERVHYYLFGKFLQVISQSDLNNMEKLILSTLDWNLYQKNADLESFCQVFYDNSSFSVEQQF